jgi:hypothetical protein
MADVSDSGHNSVLKYFLSSSKAALQKKCLVTITRIDTEDLTAIEFGAVTPADEVVCFGKKQ